MGLHHDIRLATEGARLLMDIVAETPPCFSDVIAPMAPTLKTRVADDNDSDVTGGLVSLVSVCAAGGRSALRDADLMV
jgi:hypothetical protein